MYSEGILHNRYSLALIVSHLLQVSANPCHLLRHYASFKIKYTLTIISQSVQPGLIKNDSEKLPRECYI